MALPDRRCLVCRADLRVSLVRRGRHGCIPLCCRISSYVDVRGPGECWPWTGYRDPNGYGKIHNGGHNGRVSLAHRALFLLITGDSPSEVRHTCDHPWCCNPAHHKPGTHADNMRDKVERGRATTLPRPGSLNPFSKLTEASVKEIREMYEAGGITQKQIARRFGVTQPAIGYLLRRVTWRHVA